MRTVRYQDRRLAVALGFNVAVYAGIVACFAVGLFWLMQPTVLKNHGLAAYKPLPGTVVNYADSARLPPAPSELPETVGVAEPTPQAVAPQVVESPAVAPKKEIKKRETRAMPARERWSPFWDNAAAPSRGYRPWF